MLVAERVADTVGDGVGRLPMGESASFGRDYDRTETYQREPKNTADPSNCQYDTISKR